MYNFVKSIFCPIRKYKDLEKDRQFNNNRIEESEEKLLDKEEDINSKEEDIELEYKIKRLKKLTELTSVNKKGIDKTNKIISKHHTSNTTTSDNNITLINLNNSSEASLLPETMSISSPLTKVISPIKDLNISTFDINSDDSKLDYINNILEDIFIISLFPLDQQATNKRYTYLSELSFESIHNSLGVAKLTLDQLESAIIERCQLPFSAHMGPFSYLLSCYTRASESLSALSPTKSKKDEFKLNTLNSILDIIVAYAGMCLSGALAENDIENTRSTFIRLLEADPNISKTLPKGFLSALVSKFEADNMLLEQFDFVLRYIQKTMLPAPLTNFSIETGQPIAVSPITLEAALKSLRLIETLGSQAPLALMVINLPSFSSSSCSNGRDIEIKTLLGQSFGFSPFSTEFKNQIMKSINANENPHLRAQDYNSLNEALKLQIQNLQNQLFKTVNALMRINPICREACLAWLSSSLVLNSARSKFSFNESLCCSHGFATNISAVLVRLCRPIIDNKQEKMKLVDLRYLLGGDKTRLDYSKIDRMGATNKDIREIVETERNIMSSSPTNEEDASKSVTLKTSFNEFTPNFVTEIFFLTLQSLQLGLMRTVKASGGPLQQHISTTFKAYDNHLKSKPDSNYGPNSPYDTNLQMLLTKLRTLLFLDQAYYITYANIETLRIISYFYEWTCNFFLLRLKLDSPREQTLLKLMPEHFVENIVEFFELLGRTAIDIIRGEKWTSLLSFVCQCVQRVSGDTSVTRTAVGELQVVGELSLIKNPHLRAMLADILCLFLPPRQPDNTYRREVDHPFILHPTLSAELVPSLLRLYVDVEYTGRHAQFYEKFNSRQKINQLLEFVWDYAKHRATFDDISHSTTEDFPRFINSVISDSIFLLDESIKYLTTVREIEEKKDNQQVWFQLTPDQRTELETQHDQSGNSARQMMTFGKSTFRLLAILARHLTHAFLQPMFAQSMANMLDYYIYTLAGPKVRELKVKDMEKYSFSPKELLREILLIFIPLADSEVFRSFVIADQRSYQPAIFKSALNLGVNKGILQTPTDKAALEKAVNELEIEYNALQIKIKKELESATDVEAPDEFMDPITSELMSDPVMLPSKAICDRNTIIRHLWSQPTDPFTQMPLKLEQLVEVPDLKDKIIAWKKENNVQ